MSTYIDEYNEYRNKIKQRLQELSALLSQADLEEQDLLHFLEFEKCDAITMVKTIKELKNIRIKRRVIKNEFEDLQRVSCRLGKELKTPNEKTYTYKTNVADKLLNKTN